VVLESQADARGRKSRRNRDCCCDPCCETTCCPSTCCEEAAPVEVAAPVEEAAPAEACCCPCESQCCEPSDCCCEQKRGRRLGRRNRGGDCCGSSCGC
jgi:hypothetical protein